MHSVLDWLSWLAICAQFSQPTRLLAVTIDSLQLFKSTKFHFFWTFLTLLVIFFKFRENIMFKCTSGAKSIPIAFGIFQLKGMDCRFTSSDAPKSIRAILTIECADVLHVFHQPHKRTLFLCHLANQELWFSNFSTIAVRLESRTPKTIVPSRNRSGPQILLASLWNLTISVELLSQFPATRHLKQLDYLALYSDS